MTSDTDSELERLALEHSSETTVVHYLAEGDMPEHWCLVFTEKGKGQIYEARGLDLHSVVASAKDHFDAP